MSRFARALALSSLLALTSSLAACEQSATPDAGTDSGHRYGGDDACGQIIDACHDVDMGGTGPIPECHSLGHDEDLPLCEANVARCVAICRGEDAGVPEDASVDAGDTGVLDAGDPHERPDGSVSVCREIANRCHELDPEDGGPISQCHDLGHAGNEALCEERRDECLALCPETA